MIKAVFFDLDGVLTCEESVWSFLHLKLGTSRKAEVYRGMYWRGEIDYERWAFLDAALWKGVPLHVVTKLVEGIPYTKGAFETISELRRLGIKSVVISSGLSVLSDKVKVDLGLDYAISNDLIVMGGVLTGEVKVNVTDRNKGLLLRDIANRLSIDCSECAAVGNDDVDIPLLKEAGLSIAFNPKDPKVKEEADFVIFNDDLRAILPLLPPQ